MDERLLSGIWLQDAVRHSGPQQLLCLRKGYLFFRGSTSGLGSNYVDRN